MIEKFDFQKNQLQSIEAVVEKLLLQSRFITKCSNKTIKLNELKKFIVQHSFYSKYFTRYICALLSNMDNQNDFISLIDNLCDELGLNDHSCVPHSVLYQNMAQRLNVDISGLIHASTQNLIDAMFNYCRNPDPIYGISALCLGAEAIVPLLYSSIVNGFEKNGIHTDQLEFFTVHIQCDDGHANILRNILIAALRDYPEKYDIVRNVSESMINHRINFLDALLD